MRVNAATSQREDGLPVIEWDFANGARLAVAVGSAATAALSAGVWRLVADTNCYITTGAAPTAAADTAGNFYLAAGTVFDLVLGSSVKVAAIRDTADGSLYLLPGKAV